MNVLITSVSIPVACWIAGGTWSNTFSILLAGCAGALVTAGANAINDVFDIDIDCINRPDRVLPSGNLTVNQAKRFWYVTSMLALVFTTLLSLIAFVIVLCAIVILYFYSAYLKRTVLVGNVVVALMTGMAFIYGGVVVANLGRALIPALFAFLINLAREVVKDIEDMEGDNKEKAGTFPLIYGVFVSRLFISSTLVLLVILTVLIGDSNYYNHYFLYVVLLSDLCILFGFILLWRVLSQSRLHQISVLLKSSMILGLLAIIVGSFTL